MCACMHQDYSLKCVSTTNMHLAWIAHRSVVTIDINRVIIGGSFRHMEASECKNKGHFRFHFLS